MQEWSGTAGMFLCKTTVSIFCSGLHIALTTVLLKPFESAVSNVIIYHHVQFFSSPRRNSARVFEDYLINNMHTVQSVLGNNAEGVFRRKKKSGVSDSATEWLCCDPSLPLEVLPSQAAACTRHLQSVSPAAGPRGVVPPKAWDVPGLGSALNARLILLC